MRAAGFAAGSVVVVAALLLGPGTAVAAPDTTAPVAPTVSSDGGTGGDACAHLPVGLQELLCPGAGDESATGNAESAATGATGSGSAATGGTAATAPAATGPATTAPASGGPASSAPAPGGVVSNFLIWLAGLFAYLGL